MLEKPSMDSAVNVTTAKLYAPPNQRNRSLGRRKSGGERLDRANSYPNDGEKIPIGAFNSIPKPDHVDAAGNHQTNENSCVKLIQLHGCGNNEALQVLNDRWTAAMSALNNLPEDSSEKPVLYSRKSALPWAQAMLPHLIMEQASEPSTGSQRDFLSELRQAMNNANAGRYT